MINWLASSEARSLRDNPRGINRANLMHSFNQFYALFRQANEFGELFASVIADIAEAAVSHVEEESDGSR